MERITGATADANANGTGKSGFSDGSPSGGLPTVLTPEWCNQVQEEIVGAIEAAGLTPSGADTGQLLQAVAAGAPILCADTGAANALVLSPVVGGPGVLIDGLTVRARVAVSNTAAATLDYNGTGAKTITQADVSGVLRSGVFYTFVYNATTTEWETAGALGEGQAWRDVAASRELATDYSNDTGRAIQVAATIGGSGGGTPAVQGLVDGVVASQENDGTSESDSTTVLIVPPGSTYRINATSGGAAVSFWAELR